MVKRCLPLLLLLLLTGCAAREQPVSAVEPVGRMELAYAEEFTVDYYDGGAALVTIAGEDRYLLVPEGAVAPDVADATVLHTPLDNLYLDRKSVV